MKIRMTDQQLLAILCLIALATAIAVEAKREYAELARKEAKP